MKKNYKKEEEKNKINLLYEKHKSLEEKFGRIVIKKDIINVNSLINQSRDPGSSENIRRNDHDESDRELYDIEQEMIDEFNIEVIKIDKKIDELGNAVTVLKLEAEKIGNQIRGMPITKIIPKAVFITKEVKSKTEMVNDYIKEIKKPCNFCCDLILILILLGLICILISIIRHKYF